mgnify:CR=1 FL=1
MRHRVASLFALLIGLALAVPVPAAEVPVVAAVDSSRFRAHRSVPAPQARMQAQSNPSAITTISSVFLFDIPTPLRHEPAIDPKAVWNDASGI